jgi:hypothetical protein
MAHQPVNFKAPLWNHVAVFEKSNGNAISVIMSASPFVENIRVLKCIPVLAIFQNAVFSYPYRPDTDTDTCNHSIGCIRIDAA